MKIRQYIASTMQEARLKIKLDLGPDAVILHSRTFKKGGILGFFGQERVEVLAAIDSQPTATSPFPPTFPNAPGTYERMVSPMASPLQPDLGGMERYARPEPVAIENPRPPEEPPRREAVVPPPALSPDPAPSGSMKVSADTASPRAQQEPVSLSAPVLRDREVEDLKSAVGELRSMLATVVEQLEVQPVRTHWSATQQLIYDKLLRLEIDPNLARGLITLLLRQGATGTFEEQADLLMSPLTSLVRCVPSFSVTKGQQRIIALVGPTGVGKTTTIAKLAANFRLTSRYDIGLITIDTYRVAAVEQLKTYGDIIGIPVEVVLTPSALKDALAAFRGKDVVLIDTAGRSPQNRMHLNELKGFLDIPQAHEIHLVMSATTNRQNLKDIAESFAPVGPERLIFTKTDETVSIGGPLSVAHQLGIPISFITTGQSVPDDIREADSGYLAELMIDELKR